MTTYQNPFTGQTINPSQVGYESLSISTNTTLQWPINGNNSNVVANIMDITATVGSLSLILPSAQQVSVGQNIIIRNVGSNSFNVTNAGSSIIATIASGIANFIYLTDNSTDNGVWTVITFGAGTSSANAATLAGLGLTALNTTLNQSYNLSTISSAYTLLPSDRAKFIVWNGGAGVLTLPPSADVGNNWFAMVRNGGSGVVTIATQGVDTIDGNSNQQLQLTESLVIVCNGSGYNTFAYGRSNQFAFTTFTKTVTGGTVTLTSVEGANVIQSYIGTLTSNCVVIVPSTVQLYSIQNSTTGAFSLTFRTSAVGGATYTLPQGQTVILVCDGTNVYNANTSTSSSSITSLTLANGAAASPTLNFNGDLLTGLYLVGSNQLGFTAGGTNRMTLTTSGLLVPVGISGGTF
jgi:hypothetical protein